MVDEGKDTKKLEDMTREELIEVISEKASDKTVAKIIARMEEQEKAELEKQAKEQKPKKEKLFDLF